MQRRVLDSEFAHWNSSSFPTVELLCKLKMVEDNVSLAVQGRRRGQWLSVEDRLALVKDPWITDAASRYGDPIDSRFLHHSEAVIGSEKITTPENHFIGTDVLLYFLQKIPPTGANVALHHGASVDRDRINS